MNGSINDENWTKAMDLAFHGDLACRDGNIDLSKEYYRQSYDIVNQLAFDIRTKFNFEPTRSVVLQSAATLAISLSNLRDAEKHLYWVLVGEPEDMILQEARDMLMEILRARSKALEELASLAQELNMGY